MQASCSAQVLTVLVLLAAVAGARRCHVSHPPGEPGARWTSAYETCAPGLDFCFRGRLTSEGQVAVKELFQWPVHRGQMLQACAESLDPPLDEMWGWYELKSVRVCRVDGCNS